MRSTLISALVERRAFVEDTIITARYNTIDLFGRAYEKIGDFKLKKIHSTKEDILLELVIIDNSSISIKASADAISAVDGMDLHRFADVYDLLPDGRSKKIGRKRGRKPKNQLTV